MLLLVGNRIVIVPFQEHLIVKAEGLYFMKIDLSLTPIYNLLGGVTSKN
jgi:hypothetical protein